MPLSALVSVGLNVLSSKEAIRNREVILRAIKSSSKDIKELRKLLSKKRGKKRNQKGVIKVIDSYVNFLQELINLFKSYSNRGKKNIDNLLAHKAEVRKEYGKHGSDEDLSRKILKKLLRLYKDVLEEIREYQYIHKRLMCYKQDIVGLLSLVSKPQRNYKKAEKHIISEYIPYIEKLLKKRQNKKKK